MLFESGGSNWASDWLGYSIDSSCLRGILHARQMEVYWSHQAISEFLETANKERDED